MIEKEEMLLYPPTSFVAEVGGALGLFLGFSFLGLWDIIIVFINLISNKIKNWCVFESSEKYEECQNMPELMVHLDYLLGHTGKVDFLFIIRKSSKNHYLN